MPRVRLAMEAGTHSIRPTSSGMAKIYSVCNTGRCLAAWRCMGRVYGLWSESTIERRSITRSRLLHAPDFREPAAARCLALRDEAETTLVRSHLESNQFQQATRPTTSAGIGNGTPSSAESFWGAQHAFVNLDRSACIAWSSRRTKSVSRKMRAAPACFGGTIL